MEIGPPQTSSVAQLVGHPRLTARRMHASRTRETVRTEGNPEGAPARGKWVGNRAVVGTEVPVPQIVLHRAAVGIA